MQIHLTDRLDSMFIIGSGIPTESNAHARRMIIPPCVQGRDGEHRRSLRPVRIDLRGPAQNRAGPIGGGWRLRTVSLFDGESGHLLATG